VGADITPLPILYRLRKAPEGSETLAAATHVASNCDPRGVAELPDNHPPAGPFVLNKLPQLSDRQSIVNLDAEIHHGALEPMAGWP
jgi:hypothetical protein